MHEFYLTTETSMSGCPAIAALARAASIKEPDTLADYLTISSIRRSNASLNNVESQLS